MIQLRRRLDLQAKIILILIAVIVPTFVIVTFAEHKLTRPILEDDLRLFGIHSATTLGSEILTRRLLFRSDAPKVIEGRIQEILYTQPNVLRMEVITRDANGQPKVIASNIEDEEGVPSPPPVLNEALTSDYRVDESGTSYWEVSVPIEQKSRDPRGPKRFLGAVRVAVSLKMVEGVLASVWRATASAALFTVATLIIALSYFLRKTIANDRKLRKAETQNIQLAEQLHETQRDLMNTEKLAVMGQLTASFAHEIGTPLTAIGGHLQLLAEEMGEQKDSSTRVGIIQGQLSKIEGIVKGFLQSTAKPPSQYQLVDVNSLIERTLQIVTPRVEALHVQVARQLDRGMGPVRIVPVDLEQVLLNLVNNSLDSLRAKGDGLASIEIESCPLKADGREWAQISVYDTGEGIRKTDLGNVLKPFFTTKRPGEGTGLGLTICQQLVHKYGGRLLLDSREGQWTKVTIRIPYV